MTILRKIFGILLLILSLFLILGTTSSTIKVFANVPEDSVERIGYFIGLLFFIALMGWLLFFTMRKAIQLLKNKPQSNIDEIGQL